MNDYASPWKGLAWLTAVIVLAVIVGAGLPPFIRMIPWSWEQKLAANLLPDPADNACHADPKKRAILQRLVERLFPLDKEDMAISIDVHIVNGREVNAYAGLGGEITVYSGLIGQAQSPEELAGVLAHEITHVRRRHVLQGTVLRLLTNAGARMIFSSSDDSWKGDWAGFFMNMGFSRDQEREADEGALLRLQKAHIDNHGFAEFFERLGKSSVADQFLSDHPTNEDRAEMVKNFANQDVKPVMSKEEWAALRHYCDGENGTPKKSPVIK